MASIIGSAAHAAHSAAVALTSVSPIKVGGMLPHVTVKEDDPEKSLMIASTGKIVIVGLPAAFSPPCNSQVPGYIEHYDKLKAKGVSEVYIVAVNDAFVTKAWKTKLASEGTPVRFIADDSGAFTGALGLLFDAGPLLGGPRSKRYVLTAEGGKVTYIAVEEDPTKVKITTVDHLLAHLL